MINPGAGSRRTAMREPLLVLRFLLAFAAASLAGVLLGASCLRSSWHASSSVPRLSASG